MAALISKPTASFKLTPVAHAPSLLRATAAPAVPLSPPQIPPPLPPKPLPKLYYKWERSGLKLNLFGAYYGFVAISLGFAWFAALKAISIVTYTFAKVGVEVDTKKGWGVRANGIWGWLVLRLTGNSPIITGKYRSRALLKGKPADSPGVMYVANHCSWMDIPYVAMAIGVSRNFKIVAKKEVREREWGFGSGQEMTFSLLTPGHPSIHQLLRVPILGSAISTSDNITVDRSSRRR